MQPYDYTKGMQTSMLPAMQQGVMLSQIMNKAEQERLAQQSQASMQYDLAKLSSNPNATAQDYSAVMTKYPSLSENLKRSWDVLGEGKQKTAITEGTQIYSALVAKKPEVAMGIVDQKIAAAENSGNKEEAQKAKVMKQLITTNPDAAKTSIAMTLASVDDKFAENMAKINKDVRETQLQPGEIVKQGEDIETSRLDRQIKVAEQARKNADSEAKRNEIQAKIDELSKKRDDIVKNNQIEYETQAMAADNVLNTTSELLALGKGAISGATGTVWSLFPTIRDKSAKVERLVEALGSQLFLSNADKLKGVLTDNDTKELKNSLRSLSLQQSPDDFMNSLKEVERLTTKARTIMAKKYGVKETVPDTPAAELTTPEIDALLQEYGG